MHNTFSRTIQAYYDDVWQHGMDDTMKLLLYYHPDYEPYRREIESYFESYHKIKLICQELNDNTTPKAV